MHDRNATSAADYPIADGSVPASLPRLGNRVRLRDSRVQALGLVVEELTEVYVRVKWDEVTLTTTHRRESLEIVT